MLPVDIPERLALVQCDGAKTCRTDFTVVGVAFV